MYTLRRSTAEGPFIPSYVRRAPAGYTPDYFNSGPATAIIHCEVRGSDFGLRPVICNRRPSFSDSSSLTPLSCSIFSPPWVYSSARRPHAFGRPFLRDRYRVSIWKCAHFFSQSRWKKKQKKADRLNAVMTPERAQRRSPKWLFVARGHVIGERNWSVLPRWVSKLRASLRSLDQPRGSFVLSNSNKLKRTGGLVASEATFDSLLHDILCNRPLHLPLWILELIV